MYMQVLIRTFSNNSSEIFEFPRDHGFDGSQLMSLFDAEKVHMKFREVVFRLFAK